MSTSGCFACLYPYVFFLRRLFPKIPTKSRDWGSDIAPDVLEVISDRLPLRDFITFRSVCRYWRSAPSGRSKIAHFSKNRPWLMFYGFDKKDVGVCYLYCHPHPNCCTVRSPELDQDATVMESKSGWLFVRGRRGRFFLFNLFTLVKIDLPEHAVYEDQACTMTSTSVFIVSRRDDANLVISFCRIGDTTWENHTAEISKAYVGTLLAIAACDCTGSSSGHSCGLLDKMHISISGSRTRLAYDYSEKRYFELVGGQTRKEIVFRVAHRQFREVSLDDDFVGLREYFVDSFYRKDWRERFNGGKGISVSVCATRTRTDEMRRDAIAGIGRYTRVVKGDGELSTELKHVKASWIEPSFV